MTVGIDSHLSKESALKLEIRNSLAAVVVTHESVTVGGTELTPPLHRAYRIHVAVLPSHALHWLEVSPSYPGISAKYLFVICMLHIVVGTDVSSYQ